MSASACRSRRWNITRSVFEMQKLFLIAALTLALPIIAQAQEATRTEFFAGYSYMRLEDSPNTQDQDLNGYNVSGAVTIFKKSIAIKADVSGHYGNVLVSITPQIGRASCRERVYVSVCD